MVVVDSNGVYIFVLDQVSGAEPGGGGGGAPGSRPPKIGKNKICWRKIVIFHTKYPKNLRASLHSAHFFLSAPR
jgi:hypothetical protein